jgi:uncharacterized SAM-binding protein YcdF (DUF218 family)
MAGHSTGLEQLVVESDEPRPARAIVCVTGGVGNHRLPTPEGWDRVYTAVQLLADGVAPTVVFSGGGSDRMSEAETYAEAARWLGCPANAIVLDPVSGSTAEHPANLLKLPNVPIRRDTPLLVVTSRLHSKRTAMCFRKWGYTDVRVVTSYEARRSPLARASQRSTLEIFKPSDKSYSDPLNTLRWRLNDELYAMREILAILVYRYRGQA